MKEPLCGTDRPAHRMSSAVRDLGELEPYLGRRAALHLHFARLRAEAWRGHTHAVGTLRQRAAGGAVVATSCDVRTSIALPGSALPVFTARTTAKTSPVAGAGLTNRMAE